MDYPIDSIHTANWYNYQAEYPMERGGPSGRVGKVATPLARAPGPNPSNVIWQFVMAAPRDTYRVGYTPLWGLGPANRLARPGHGAAISDSRIDDGEEATKPTSDLDS